MKAAVLKNSEFEITDIPKPILDEYGKGAIVKVICCGLCGSDIVKMQSGKLPQGTVLGHEVVGEIVEINSNTAFSVGDRVALGHHVPCFNCRYCRGKSYSMCKHFKSTNIIPGGFSEYIYVSEEHLMNTVFNINLNISDIEASFLEPLACCLRAVKRAEIPDNAKTLVLGLGTIGILMGQTIKAFGYNVSGCDLIRERTCIAENFGFDKTFLLQNEQETLADMKKYAPEGFDTVFLTAGASSAVDLAVKSVRDGGTVIVFSSIKSENAFKNNDIYYRELSIKGSYSPTPVDLEDSLHLIESGKVRVGGFTEIYNITDINKALADTLSNKIMKACIKL